MPQSLKQLFQDPFKDGQLTSDVFEVIRADFQSVFSLNLVYADTDGNLIHGIPDCDEFPCIESCRQARKLAIDKALTHRTPYATRCPVSYTFWALPVQINNHTIGALITVDSKRTHPHPHPGAETSQTMLIDLAERFNIINRAFLDQQRAILDGSRPHSVPSKGNAAVDLTTLWSNHVHAVLGATAMGEIPSVLKHLQPLFDSMREQEPTALDELKGFALEFFAAVVEQCLRENGHRQSCFRYHCETASAILTCSDVPGLCDCLAQRLTEFLNAQRHRIRSHDKNTLISKVYSFIETNLHRSINREHVAQHVGISPSRLSHILKEEVNESYSEILNRFRLEQARKLLISSDEPISSIASDCGYFDQSHFSKAFHKRFGVAPLEYRRNFHSN